MGLEIEIRASDSPRHFFFFKEKTFCFFSFKVAFLFVLFLIFLKKFVDYLFLVLLDFCCCSWTSSGFGEPGLLSGHGEWASHCLGFSCWWRTGSRHVGSVIVHGLSCLVTWNLSGPEIEPMSPALAGRFLTTVPTGTTPLATLESVCWASLVAQLIKNPPAMQESPV